MSAPKVNRGTRNMQKLRKEFRTQCETTTDPCWLCGQPIDYTAPKDHPDAFELDHYYPVSTHPQHAEDRAGFRPSHRSCNGARGNTDPADILSIGQQSRVW